MKAPAPLYTRKEGGYPLPYEQLKTGIKRQIALGKRCQSVDPMSCSKWISCSESPIHARFRIHSMQQFVRLISKGVRWLVTCRCKNNAPLFLINVSCMLSVLSFRGGGVAAYLASSEDGKAHSILISHCNRSHCAQKAATALIFPNVANWLNSVYTNTHDLGFHSRRSAQV